MEILKVEITSSKPGYWYYGLEGQVLEVYDNGRDYILKEDYDRGHRAQWGHIDKQDCKPVGFDDHTRLVQDAAKAINAVFTDTTVPAKTISKNLRLLSEEIQNRLLVLKINSDKNEK